MKLDSNLAAVLRPVPVVLIAAYLVMAHVAVDRSTNTDALGRKTSVPMMFGNEFSTSVVWFSKEPGDNWSDAIVVCALCSAFVWFGRQAKVQSTSPNTSA